MYRQTRKDCLIIVYDCKISHHNLVRVRVREPRDMGEWLGWGWLLLGGFVEGMCSPLTFVSCNS